MVFTASLLGAQHKKGIVWRTSQKACLLCPWEGHLTGRLHLYVADRWPTRTSLGYNCEVANPACRKKRLLDTHQWQSYLLVMGLPVTHDWFEMGCHLSPVDGMNLNCRSCRTSIPRKRRGNYNNNNNNYKKSKFYQRLSELKQDSSRDKCLRVLGISLYISCNCSITT